MQMPLREAHDIGERLQDTIERLDDVERCFVHLDWEVSNISVVLYVCALTVCVSTNTRRNMAFYRLAMPPNCNEM